MTLEEFLKENYPEILDQFNASDSDDIELWTEDVYPDIFDEWNDAENYENFYTETTFYGSEL